MRPIAALVLALAAACSPATAARGTRPSGPTTVIPTGDGAYVNIAAETRGSSIRLAAAPQQVWRALPAAYAEFGIPVGTVDEPSLTYGNQRFAANRRLGDVSLAELFRCGNTATGAPIATAYRLRILVLTRLQAVSDGQTEVATTAQATATSNAGASADPVVCASTGALEERIAVEIRARVGS